MEYQLAFIGALEFPEVPNPTVPFNDAFVLDDERSAS